VGFFAAVLGLGGFYL